MNGRLVNRRLRRALRAGYLALLAGLLCAAALAAPALSAAQEFSHSHADGAPGHLHPVASVIGGTPAPAAVVGLEVRRQETLILRIAPSDYVHLDTPRPRSRGPPRRT